MPQFDLKKYKCCKDKTLYSMHSMHNIILCPCISNRVASIELFVWCFCHYCTSVPCSGYCSVSVCLCLCVCVSVCVCVCVCVLGQSPSHLPPREEGFKTFYEWLKLHKAEFDKVNTCTDMFLYIPVLSCTQSARSGFVLSP